MKKTSNRTKQAKRMTRQAKKTTEKKPLAVKLLVKQIQEGIRPSREELEEYFEDIAEKHYKDIALALLGSSQSPSKRVTQQEQGKPPQRRQAPPKVSETKAFTPSQLRGGASVIGKG